MEYIDVCNEAGLPTGEIVERSVAHAQGIRHRTAHVWIVRFEGGRPQVLLQKRSLNKDSFPGQLDTSSAGHIPAGVEPADSALRELEEELGLKAEHEDLIPVGSFHVNYTEVFHGKRFHDNEYANVFVYRKPVDAAALVLQQEELSGVEWHDFEETCRLCEAHDPLFCAPIKGLRVVESWLNRQKTD